MIINSTICVTGVTGTSGRAGSGSGLTVALPPPRTSSQSSLPTTPSTTVVSQPGPPPRPPPPRASPSGSLGRGGSPSGRAESQVTTTPPSLPPKQFRGGPQASPVHPAALMQSPPRDGFTATAATHANAATTSPDATRAAECPPDGQPGPGATTAGTGC